MPSVQTPTPTAASAAADFALAHFAALRSSTDDHLRVALSRRGDTALSKARAIDIAHTQLLGALVLVQLIAHLGDQAAADRVEAAWEDASRYLIEAAHAARMAHVPGWNPATRDFDRRPAAATTGA